MIGSLFLVENVRAAEHSLEELNINVFINDDGSARITENRIAHLSEGTENFIVIGNLSKSEIKDFIVREEGKVYQFIDDWDIDASLSDKKFKNGIIKTKDGYELSWGIGDYGKHEYQIEYTITNFIKQLEDNQVLFWRFVNDQTNTPPKKVTVNIETSKQLNADTEKIWGFGFSGNINFHQGNVVAESNQSLDAENYVTILIQFANGTFATGDRINKSFEEVKEKAFAGSSYGMEENSGEGFPWKFLLLFFIFLPLFINKFKRRNKRLTKKKPKKFTRKYKEEYYRDYPIEGNFTDIYYLLYLMGASNFKNLLTAYILKWVKEEKIIVDKEKVDGSYIGATPTIYFFSKDVDKSSIEGELFHMMLTASGDEDILQESEFSTWAETNYEQLIDWEKRVVNESLKKLKDAGYVESRVRKVFFINKTSDELTKSGELLERKVYQYINYLHDFSLLDEHKVINVKIWDEVMIWAALLGITDVVRKQLKKLYPKYTQETIYSADMLYITNSFTQRTSDSRYYTSSAGGGGSTSIGGGGGSFGGGSGGGTR